MIKLEGEKPGLFENVRIGLIYTDLRIIMTKDLSGKNRFNLLYYLVLEVQTT